jgi:hypothetical protein
MVAVTFIRPPAVFVNLAKLLVGHSRADRN